MKLTNRKMDDCLNALVSISERATGKMGYSVARNIRKLSEELTEYQSFKDKTIVKYGTTDENGQARIQVGSEAYNSFVNEMKEYMDIEHDVQIFTVTEEEVLKSDLNAKEILAIDFMIQD